MRQRTRLWAGAAVVAIMASRGVALSEPPRQDDRAVSAGRWRIVAVTMNGKEVTPEITGMLSIAYEPDGKWSLFFKSVVVAEGVSANDPDTDPKSFTMQTLGTAHRPGRRYWGIYEMDGDHRRICFSAADRPRPEEFSSARSSGQTLVEFRRSAGE